MNLGIPLARPPWSALGKELESTFRKALFDFSLLENNVKNVAIALSGGKDSLSLLFLMNAIRGRGFPNFNLFAVHVDGLLGRPLRCCSTGLPRRESVRWY